MKTTSMPDKRFAEVMISFDRIIMHTFDVYWVLMQDDIRTSYIAGYTRTGLRMHLSEFFTCVDLVTLFSPM